MIQRWKTQPYLTKTSFKHLSLKVIKYAKSSGCLRVHHRHKQSSVYCMKTNEPKPKHALMKTQVWLIPHPKFNFRIIKQAGCKPWCHLERLNAQSMANPLSLFFFDRLSLCLCLLKLCHTCCSSNFNNGMKEWNAPPLLPKLKHNNKKKILYDFWCA